MPAENTAARSRTRFSTNYNLLETLFRGCPRWAATPGSTCEATAPRVPCGASWSVEIFLRRSEWERRWDARSLLPMTRLGRHLLRYSDMATGRVHLVAILVW